MFSKEVDWHVTCEARILRKLDLQSLRWLHHTIRGQTSDDLIIHIATRSISRRLIIQLCIWELYILLCDRLLDVPHHTYSLFRELRLFVSEFTSHLYPLLVKDISLMDYVRYRSSRTWDVWTVVAKNAWPFFEVNVFYEKFWDIIGQLVVSASVSKKKRVTANTQSPSKK